jgi:hypothetical protein
MGSKVEELAFVQEDNAWSKRLVEWALPRRSDAEEEEPPNRDFQVRVVMTPGFRICYFG